MPTFFNKELGNHNQLVTFFNNNNSEVKMNLPKVNFSAPLPKNNINNLS